MTSWKTYKLGDVCSRLRSGKGIPASEVSACGKFAVVGGNGVRGYTDKSNFNGQCVVVGRQGAYCGNVRYFDGEFYMTEHAVVIVGNEYADTHFLAYLLSIMELGHLSAQSAQPGLSVQTLSKLEISLPPLEEQRRIAGILGAIDDKIENNRRINTNLELQAQALYKQWFVDFEFPNEEGKPYKSSGGKMVDSELGLIPEGWRAQTFGDLIKPQKGKNITRAQVTTGSVPVVAGGLMPSCYHNTSNTHCPVVTISASGANAGYVKMYHTPIWAADCSFIDDTISKYVHFAYVFLTYNQTSIYHKQQGCAQPHIYPSHLMELQFICPTLNILDIFESWCSNIYRQVGVNIQENETLATLRDTLLPKVMKGEIITK